MSPAAKDPAPDRLRVHPATVAIVVLFIAAVSVLALQSETRRDPATAHAQMEIFGVFLGLSIFFLAATKFVATRDRVYLPLALGFFAAFLLSTVHAFLGRMDPDALEMIGPIADADLAGYAGWLARLSVAVGFLFATIAYRTPGEADRPAQKLWRGSVLTILANASLLFLFVQLPLPAYAASGLALARTLEVVPLALLAAAGGLLFRRPSGEPSTTWTVGLVAATIGVLSHAFMLGADAMFDRAYFASHLLHLGFTSVLLFGLYAEHANLFTIERRLRQTTERAHAGVIQSKRELEAIIDNIIDGIALADRTGRLVRFNKAAREILGRDPHGETPEQYTTTFMAETPEGQPYPAGEHPMVVAIQEGRRVGEKEMTIRRPNGERRWIRVGAVPLYDEAGQVGGAVAAFHDITELRTAEEAYRGLLEASPDGVVVSDENGRIRFFNAAAERLFECPRGDVLGKEVTLLMPERYHDQYQDVRKAWLRTGPAQRVRQTLEAHGRKKDGREFPIEVSFNATPSTPGVSVIANIRDVSVKHRAGREREGVLSVAQASSSTQELGEFLQRACSQVANTLEFNACTVFLADEERQHLVLRASEKVPEEVRERIREYPLQQGFPALAVQTYFENRTLIEPHLQERADLVVGQTLTRKYGFQVVLSSPIREGVETLGVVQVIADQKRHPQEEDVELLELLAHELGLAIQQKNLIRQLERSSLDLRRANQELDSFIYTASHDLSEPLRSISNFSHFVLEDYADRLDAEGQDYLRRVNAGAGRMKRLLDDLLRLSRFGRHQVRSERLSLQEIVRDVQESLDASLRERQAEIIVHGTLPEIYADRTSITEVFANLISNGIKFNQNPNPRVEIGASRRDGTVEYYVKDNGIGISPEHHERIFGLFTRLGSDKQYPGTGAGLAIVKKIVETQGGRIRVESSPGTGSTFYFTLPARLKADAG